MQALAPALMMVVLDASYGYTFCQAASLTAQQSNVQQEDKKLKKVLQVYAVVLFAEY